MKTIEHVSNFGRFAYTATAAIGDEVNAETTKLCLEGLASVCYRAGGSEAEKALVKDGGVLDTAGRAITKDTKRSEVAYSEHAMVVLQKSFDVKMKEVVAKNGLPAVTVLFTGEHEFGEGAGSSRKMATTLVAQMRGEKDEKRRAMRFTMLGVSEGDEDAVVVEAAHAFLSSLRAGGK